MSLRKLRSKLSTSIAYDGGAAAKEAGLKHKVTLEPGVNVLNDTDVALLEADKHFRKHMEAGHFVALPDEDAPVDEAADESAADVVADPRARLEGESKANHTKRLKALDDRAAVVDAYFGADEATKAAMLPTLDDETKAAIDADPRNTPKED